MSTVSQVGMERKIGIGKGVVPVSQACSQVCYLENQNAAISSGQPVGRPLIVESWSFSFQLKPSGPLARSACSAAAQPSCGSCQAKPRLPSPV